MSRESTRRKIWVVGLALAIAMVPAVAFGFHGQEGFEDVPEDHTFHDDIAWMHDTGVTRGCNPPENDEYCPERALIRGEEAAFFHRYDTYLRDSLEQRLVPEDCDENQIAQWNGENWECADQVGVEDGLSVASGDPATIDPATSETLTASCAEGDVALTGSAAPLSEDVTVVNTTIENGSVTIEVANNSTEVAAVTAYAICTTA